MNVAAVGDDNAAMRDESRLASIKRVLSGMFDFSLLRTVAFVPILAAGVLGFFGSLSRFSYIVDSTLSVRVIFQYRINSFTGFICSFKRIY